MTDADDPTRNDYLEFKQEITRGLHEILESPDDERHRAEAFDALYQRTIQKYPAVWAAHHEVEKGSWYLTRTYGLTAP